MSHMKPETTTYITVAKAAAILGSTVDHIAEQAAAQVLPSVDADGVLYVSRAAVLEVTR